MKMNSVVILPFSVDQSIGLFLGEENIHDNLWDFKIGRPPYLPDLKKGAYLFGGWWGFRGLKMQPRVKLWGE